MKKMIDYTLRFLGMSVSGEVIYTHNWFGRLFCRMAVSDGGLIEVEEDIYRIK